MLYAHPRAPADKRQIKKKKKIRRKKLWQKEKEQQRENKKLKSNVRGKLLNVGEAMVIITENNIIKKFLQDSAL